MSRKTTLIAVAATGMFGLCGAAMLATAVPSSAAPIVSRSAADRVFALEITDARYLHRRYYRQGYGYPYGAYGYYGGYVAPYGGFAYPYPYRYPFYAYPVPYAGYDLGFGFF